VSIELCVFRCLTARYPPDGVYRLEKSLPKKVRFQGKVYGNEGLPGDAESHLASLFFNGIVFP
jgi:hypothetical protein